MKKSDDGNKGCAVMKIKADAVIKKKGFTFTISMLLLCLTMVAMASYAQEWRKSQQLSFTELLPSEGIRLQERVSAGLMEVLGADAYVRKTSSNTSSAKVEMRLPFKKEGLPIVDIKSYASGLPAALRGTGYEASLSANNLVNSSPTVTFISDSGSMVFSNDGPNDVAAYNHPRAWRPSTITADISCDKTSSSVGELAISEIPSDATGTSWVYDDRVVYPYNLDESYWCYGITSLPGYCGWLIENSTNYVYSGTQSLKMIQENCGELAFLSWDYAVSNNLYLNATQYSGFHFAVNGGPTGVITLEFSLRSTAGRLSYTLGSIPANTWRVFDIPMSTINPQNLSFRGTSFRERSSTYCRGMPPYLNVTYYVDELYLVPLKTVTYTVNYREANGRSYTRTNSTYLTHNASMLVGYADGTQLLFNSSFGGNLTANFTQLSYTKSPGAALMLPFDSNASVSAGAVRDYSPFKNNMTPGGGTSANAPAWASYDCAAGSGCYNFDGINDFINGSIANYTEAPLTFPLGPEKLKDGGFNLSTGTPDDGLNDTWSNWTLANPNGHLFESTYASVSEKAVKITTTGLGNTRSNYLFQTFRFAGTTKLNLTFWTRPGAATPSAEGQYSLVEGTNGYSLQDDGDWAGGQANLFGTGVAGTTYQMVTKIFSPAAGSSNISLRFHPSGEGNGDVVYYDNASITQILELNGGFEYYFPDNTT